ncbi:histone-lysine N-trimethyltransferase SMYD5 isoform X1 [Bacillus rossius redtenbacheri]|uniref:histone-lysine N-trimethyltransferase SMYD5 isoform X1 n=1 Tax=Bacillus rossius redtenbacheri TaxID=93214 RepID=UPI002FDCBF45
MESGDVEVRFVSELKGRGVFANRPFKAGDVLFEEEPVVCCQFSWNAAYNYAACDYCMRPLETTEDNVRRLSGRKSLVLPYPECCPTDRSRHVQCPHCGVRYCSAACRDAAWGQFHRTLCLGSPDCQSHPLQRLDEAWRQMHYPPETASVMLIARMIATVRQAGDPEAAIASFMQFCHRSSSEEQQLVHKLLGEQFAGQVDVLRQLASEALCADCVRQWLTPEGFVSLLALVGTNAQGVGTSPLSAWVSRVSALPLGPGERARVDAFVDELYEAMQAEAGQFLNSEGAGLYSLQSRCNHSCQPNAEVTFPHSSSRLVLVATRDILPGEEVCVSYLDECALARSRHSRHRLLRENYLFVCTCSKCAAEASEPDETSEESGDGEDEDSLEED